MGAAATYKRKRGRRFSPKGGIAFLTGWGKEVHNDGYVQQCRKGFCRHPFPKNGHPEFEEKKISEGGETWVSLPGGGRPVLTASVERTPIIVRDPRGPAERRKRRGEPSSEGVDL